MAPWPADYLLLANLEGAPLIATIGAGALLLVLAAAVVSRWYQRVDRASALVIHGGGSPRVSFTAALVLPVVHRAERIDLSPRPITIDRRGPQGLLCADNIRVDLRLTFVVRVGRTAEDVLRVAESLGCARASDGASLEQLFAPKFLDAVTSVVEQMSFDALRARREELRDQVLEVVGRDLAGFVIDDVMIAPIEHTPLAQLDPNNIFDAEGSRRLTERAAAENIRTNELKRREAAELARMDLAAHEALLAVEAARASAEARHLEELERVTRPTQR